MKFIVSNDEIDLDITKLNENSLCGNADNFGLQPEELIEIKDKMKSVSKNMDVIKRQAQWNADHSITISSNGVPTKAKELREVKELDRVGKIQVDTDCASDEFLFLYDDNEILPNSCCNIEVVTPEVAESNDNDWLDGEPEISLEERKTYKLGEVLSDYTKLDNKYYFKFMWLTMKS